MGSWYLVRHGETDWNLHGRIQGHAGASLNDRGRRQVKMLAKRLANRKFSVVYSSDLSRATETTRTIVEDAELPVLTDPDLREFSYGEWEGLTLREVEVQHPRALAERTGKENNTFAAPGGEDTTQVLERVRQFCTRTVERHSAAEDILVVAHGGSIRALLVCLLGLTDDHFWRFRVDCGSLSIISNQPEGRVLELWNDTGHLTGKDRGSST